MVRRLQWVTPLCLPRAKAQGGSEKGKSVRHVLQAKTTYMCNPGFSLPSLANFNTNTEAKG
jgi:hypothetical protein